MDCVKCGRTGTTTRHQSACWTTLAEFVSQRLDRLQIDPLTGCVTFVGASFRPTLRGRTLAACLLEASIGRALAGGWDEVARHTCDNKRCVNWWHLVPGSQRDNVLDHYRAKNLGS